MDSTIFCLEKHQDWTRENFNFIFPNEISENLSQKRQSDLYWSRSIIRKLAIEKFGADLKDLKIIKNQWGKPSFEKAPQIHFSISHSKNLMAIIVLSEPVGIDIEEVNRLPQNQNKIRERIFSYEESHSKKDFAFIWTRKEATVKLFGISILNKEVKTNTLNDKINFTQKKIYIRTIQEKNHYVSIATQVKVDDIKLVRVNGLDF